MIIKSICITNGEEAFVFDSFSNGVNLIHSDDNNKGKTIISQGIMYALGNTPNFPRGFEDFDKYFFVVTIEYEGRTIIISRKKDTFIVKADDSIVSFDSVNEFKRFYNRNIYALPSIDWQIGKHMVGLNLFYEMFFLPQDGRLTSNIIGKGMYNKDDFLNMLFAYKGCQEDFNIEEYERIKKDIKNLEEERRVLKKSSKILKSRKKEAMFATYTAHKAAIDEKLASIEKIKEEIVELTNRKNRIINKKLKNEMLQKELASLNVQTEEGRLICSECGSTNIWYEIPSSKVRFSVTDLDTRNQIRKIIEDRISACVDDINDLDNQLAKLRSRLAEQMKDEDVSLENLVFYKNDIIRSRDIDFKIMQLDGKIAQLNSRKNAIEQANNKSKTNKKDVIDEIISDMNEFYSYAEPDDPLCITDMFTIQNINYSGSQGALFLMARLYALAKSMEIAHPIIIDHFRGGELSSLKEDLILGKLLELNRQIIMTCTLKTEEQGKYDDIQGVHSISFDEVKKFDLLTEDYVEKANAILSELKVVL